jgi:uncharacterized membrane protein YfcA
MKSRSAPRTNLGGGFIGTGVGIAGFYVWDRDMSGVVMGVVFLSIGIYLWINGRKWDRDNASSVE